MWQRLNLDHYVDYTVQPVCVNVNHGKLLFNTFDLFACNVIKKNCLMLEIYYLVAFKSYGTINASWPAATTKSLNHGQLEK
jgi:hypothetical protein